MRDFRAIDGEAIDGDYVLMAAVGNGDPDHLLDLSDRGIGSVAAIEFLLRQPPSILVCFGLNYDVNNWLRDLPRYTLRRLWERKVCYWRDYRIEWLPGRWLGVKSVDGRYVRVNEVFGFFQSSFVRALRDWGMEPPAEIETMKRRRGTFTAADRQRVVDYCSAECELLVELMGQLREACEAAETVPKNWIGAGAIASALLGSRSMDRHHTYDLELGGEDGSEKILAAYFGGRVELLRQGIFSRISTADLRSAYPAAALDLPSLDGAHLRWRRNFVPPPEHGVWRVRWALDPGSTRIAPFPVRRKTAIFYPLAGEGIYHGIEVAAAIAAGYPVEVIEGWLLTGSRSERPFSWLADLYQKRRDLQKRKHPAQKALKLGLNSIYGKLAQGYGHNSRPRWQSYFWAGYITAATRARVLELARSMRGEPLMFATDGIFATKPAVLGIGNGLGSWEPGRLDRLFAAQPGVYQGLRGDQEIVRSRGFFAQEVDYDELRRGFELEGSDYIHRYETTRFIGLGAALMRRDFDTWRRWLTETRSLLLWPERKTVGADGWLEPHPGPLLSEPYEPKVSLLDGRALDNLQGMEQPLKERM